MWHLNACAQYPPIWKGFGVFSPILEPQFRTVWWGVPSVQFSNVQACAGPQEVCQFLLYTGWKTVKLDGKTHAKSFWKGKLGHLRRWKTFRMCLVPVRPPHVGGRCLVKWSAMHWAADHDDVPGFGNFLQSILVVSSKVWVLIQCSKISFEDPQKENFTIRATKKRCHLQSRN